MNKDGYKEQTDEEEEEDVKSTSLMIDTGGSSSYRVGSGQVRNNLEMDQVIVESAAMLKVLTCSGSFYWPTEFRLCYLWYHWLDTRSERSVPQVVLHRVPSLFYRCRSEFCPER